MRIEKIAQSEEVRYARIQYLAKLLCQREQRNPDDFMEDASCEAFSVGMKIKVRGNKITIRNREYSYSELQKVTINTEGTLAVYHRDGRKLCGSIWLNSSTKNVEQFCIWVNRYHVPAEIVAGKGEKALQILILVVAFAAWFLYRALRI